MTARLLLPNVEGLSSSGTYWLRVFRWIGSSKWSNIAGQHDARPRCCRRRRARLSGPAGLPGEVDLVVGSLSQSFASNDSFVASSVPGLKHALRTFALTLADSGALSPMQASVVLAALDIIRSAEGATRPVAIARDGRPHGCTDRSTRPRRGRDTRNVQDALARFGNNDNRHRRLSRTVIELNTLYSG